MLQFNAMLFKCLGGILDMPASTIVQPLSFSDDTLLRAYKKGEIRLCQLVEICNYYRIDITPFFIEQGSTLMPTAIIVEKRNWKPITINEDILLANGFTLLTIKASQAAILMSVSEEIRNNVITGGGHSSTMVEPKTHPIRRKKIETNSDSATLREDETTGYQRQLTTDQWKYNWKLFKNLPSLIGVFPSHIGMHTGHSQTTYPHAVRMNDIRVTTLIDICNKWHIPISHFIKDVIPSNIVSSDAEWKDIKFYNDRIRKLTMPGSDTPLTMLQIANILNMDKRFIRGINHDPKKAWMSTIIQICNYVGISPMYFFNTDDVAAEIRATSAMQTEINILKNEIDNITKREKQKDSRIRHLHELLKI